MVKVQRQGQGELLKNWEEGRKSGQDPRFKDSHLPGATSAFCLFSQQGMES